MPAKPVSRLKSGRARSTRYLIPFDRANWPPTTKVRKKTTARGCPRRASTMQAMIARRMTPTRAAEFADVAHEIAGCRRGVLGAEAGEADIERVDAELRADHGEQDTDAHRSQGDDRGRRDQSDPGLGLRVEMVAEVAGEPWVARDLLGDRLGRHVRILRTRPTGCQQRDGSTDHDSGTDGQQNDHWR